MFGVLLFFCLLSASIEPFYALPEPPVAGLPEPPEAVDSLSQPGSGPLPHDESCGAVRAGGFDLPARANDGTFDPLATSFGLEIQGNVIPYRLMSIFVQPGETVEIEPVLGSPQSEFHLCAQDGSIERVSDRMWNWTAPEAGRQVVIHAKDLRTGDSVVLQAFVLHPYRGEDSIEGFRIGKYERIPLHNDPVYEMPDGLLRVTEDLHDLWISPHFQLRQFLCKQPADGAAFTRVSTRMLLKLEFLLEQVNDRGVHALSFAVLSAYRTPHYNFSIGNRTKYSRHAYGDAADIYVDEDGDGRMDDLNGDGHSDYRDAVWMSRIIEENFNSSWYAPYVGGLGIYGPKPHRGAFIHVDTRGFKARWHSP